MPILIVHLLEGRDEAQKKALMGAVTKAVTDTLQVPAESVRIILSEMKPADFAVAGLPYEEYRRSRTPADR